MRLLILPVLLAVAACASTPSAPPPSPVPTGPAPVEPLKPGEFPSGQSVSNPNEADFQRYLAGFKSTALAQGITERTWVRAMEGVNLNMKTIELSSGASGGMGRINAYLERISESQVQRGRNAMAEHRAALDAAERRTGVPDVAIAGIWGNETSYGAVLGNFYVVEALASLAYEGRRRAFFEAELIAALQLVQEGEPPSVLVGSYAGALGQVQFMPSNIIKLGLDGDGDGIRDLRNSKHDAFASAGNYLLKHGWRPGQPWLSEARLPSGFRWELAGPDITQTAGEWDAMGVRTIDGQTLSSLVPSNAPVSILLPAGHRGIPFIAFENYRRFLDYNPSQSYAIAVSHLANRLNGAGNFRQSWPSDLAGMGRTDMMELQRLLERLGYPVGPDGRYGDKTRRAIRAYQLSIGVPADGFPTQALLARLRADAVS